MNNNKKGINWNPVLNKFKEIKEAYIREYSASSLYAYDSKNETCLEYWVRKLDNLGYTDLITPLQMTEYNDMLLVRYGEYSGVSQGEEDASFNELFINFWEIHDGFYSECRSVVIDIKKDCLILTPFKKFRNLNECEQTDISKVSKLIKKAKCVEFSNKLDGSMQSARYYDGKIIMSGSKSLNPSDSWRLEDGYKMLYNNVGYEKMLKENSSLTFIFEYISLKDAHLVNYTKEQEGLYLIGIREVNTGKEYSYAEILDYAKRYNVPSTTVYNKTLDEVMSELDLKKSNEAEGFVVNIDGFKVKIKYNDYVNMHHVLSAISSVNLVIRHIADGSFDDMLSKVPFAYRERVMKVADMVFGFIADIERKVTKYYNDAPKQDVKNFMLWVDKTVPKDLRVYVRAKYLGYNYNVLKSKAGRYRKLNEMGVNSYEELFSKEQTKKRTDYERE